MKLLMLDLEGVLIWSALYPAQLKPWSPQILHSAREQEAVLRNNDNRNNVRPMPENFCTHALDSLTKYG